MGTILGIIWVVKLFNIAMTLQQSCKIVYTFTKKGCIVYILWL